MGWGWAAFERETKGNVKNPISFDRCQAWTAFPMQVSATLYLIYFKANLK